MRLAFRLSISTLSHMALCHQAAASPGLEVCGLCGGYKRQSVAAITDCLPILNVDPQPAVRFLMDETAVSQALRSFRQRGLTLIAIYHSHPRGPAHPSALDIKTCLYPDCFTLIIYPRQPVRGNAENLAENSTAKDNCRAAGDNSREDFAISAWGLRRWRPVQIKLDIEACSQ